MLEIPAELKALAEPIRALVSGAAAHLERCRGGPRADYGRFEARVAEDTTAIDVAAFQLAAATWKSPARA